MGKPPTEQWGLSDAGQQGSDPGAPPAPVSASLLDRGRTAVAELALEWLLRISPIHRQATRALATDPWFCSSSSSKGRPRILFNPRGPSSSRTTPSGPHESCLSSSLQPSTDMQPFDPGSSQVSSSTPSQKRSGLRGLPGQDGARGGARPLRGPTRAGGLSGAESRCPKGRTSE